MDQDVDRLYEDLLQAVAQVTLDDLHQRVVHHRRHGRDDPVREHETVDGSTAQGPPPEQGAGHPLPQEAEATGDEDSHAHAPR